MAAAHAVRQDGACRAVRQRPAADADPAAPLIATRFSSVRGLVDRLGPDAVLTGSAVEPYLRDATETRGLAGRADAVVVPGSADDVVAAMRWCYEHDVPITPYGGGTGYAGGAVADGGVVLSLERLNRVRALEPELWRAEFEAGVTERDGQPPARENGPLVPPPPPAPERARIGGHARPHPGRPPPRQL